MVLGFEPCLSRAQIYFILESTVRIRSLMVDSVVEISGNKITIPPRLYREVNDMRVEHENGGVEVGPDLDELLDSDEEYSISQAIYLDIARPLLGKDPVRGVLLLAIFASMRAMELRDQGKPQDGLGLLADALILEHRVLPFGEPSLTRRLSRRITIQTEEAVDLSAFIGTVDAVIAEKEALEAVFSIMETVWEPELRNPVNVLRKIPFALSNLGLVEKRQQIPSLKSVRATLVDVQKELRQISAFKTPRHIKLLGNLTTALQEIVQQEIILIASSQYNSEGLDYESIVRQASRLIGQVEQRLRMVIAEKYEKQFGASWLEHIQARHKFMYDVWLSNLGKDKAAFKVYSDHSPQILEYARFDDLVELISAQWQLFRDQLNFGFDTRNKMIFSDKMNHIAKVRNPLAHNRSIPENELLRARVFCTDILLALDSAAESAKKNE